MVDIDEIADKYPSDKYLSDEHLAQPHPVDDPQMVLERKERAEWVQRAILTLSVPNRTVLVMREYGNLSYTEIAGTLRIPLGTVMSRLNSARNQLRQSLTSLLEVL